MKQYLKEYNWPDILSMLHNLKLDPKICTESFRNRLVVITGATSGIGYAAAKKFAARGADILSVNRNEDKSKQLCEALKNEYDAKCEYLIADFTKLEDIHNVAKALSELDSDIDVLIHNAGVFSTKKQFSVDGLELVFQANYLSTFILNYYLKEKFIKQNHGRILFVNSEAHRFAVSGLYLDDLAWDNHYYTALRSYGSAKMAQLLSMIKLKEYFLDTDVTVNAMHPGNIKTNSGQNNGKIYKFFKKIFVDKSARDINISSEALYYLAASKEIENMTGKFFNLTTEETPAPPSLDKSAAEDLWKVSKHLGSVE